MYARVEDGKIVEKRIRPRDTSDDWLPIEEKRPSFDSNVFRLSNPVYEVFVKRVEKTFQLEPLAPKLTTNRRTIVSDGKDFVTVTLTDGSKPDDTEVTFNVNDKEFVTVFKDYYAEIDVITEHRGPIDVSAERMAVYILAVDSDSEEELSDKLYDPYTYDRKVVEAPANEDYERLDKLSSELHSGNVLDLKKKLQDAKSLDDLDFDELTNAVNHIYDWFEDFVKTQTVLMNNIYRRRIEDSVQQQFTYYMIT